MIHTKWDGMDRYSYSSHITHTGTYRLDTYPGDEEVLDYVTQTLATAVESTQNWNWRSPPCLPLPTTLTGFFPNTVRPFSIFVLHLLLLDVEVGRNFGQNMREDEGPKTGLKMGWSS